MSFKDQIAWDIQNTSFNNDHFSESGFFYKKDLDYSDTSSNIPSHVDMVFYPDGITRYNGEIDEKVFGDYTLYLKRVNYDEFDVPFEISVEMGDYISLDSENNTVLYMIDKIREETIGSWTCNAIKYNGIREVRRKNITDLRG